MKIAEQIWAHLPWTSCLMKCKLLRFACLEVSYLIKRSVVMIVAKLEKQSD